MIPRPASCLMDYKDHGFLAPLDQESTSSLLVSGLCYPAEPTLTRRTKGNNSESLGQCERRIQPKEGAWIPSGQSGGSLGGACGQRHQKRR